MGLQSFEHGLERMVAGVFSRGSRPSLRPVELGRRLLREMDDNRSVDVRGRRIVPNEFAFLVSEVDIEGFADFYDVLITELCETAREYARSEGYHFLGPVSVRVDADEEVRPGRCSVSSRTKEAVAAPRRGAVLLPDGRRLPLGPQPITVGRLPESSVPVNEPNVSRKHCELRAVGNGFVVVDLGSTNGTRVNGVRISGEQALSDGDVVSVGNLEMHFEAS